LLKVLGYQPTGSRPTRKHTWGEKRNQVSANIPKGRFLEMCLSPMAGARRKYFPLS
jgi:hypothetical protein